MRSKDETSDRFTMMNQCGDSPQELEMLPQGWNLQQFGEQYNRSGKRDSERTVKVCLLHFRLEYLKKCETDRI